MIKLLVIAYLCTSFTIVSSQNCTDTRSARTRLGFDNSVTTPISGSGFKYCQSLKAGTSCCTAATVDGFQDRTTTLLQNLTANVIKRDQYYVAANTNALGKLQAANERFAAALAVYQALPTGTTANPLATQQQLLVLLQGMLTNTASILTGYTRELPAITLKQFQSERTSCVIEMVRLQSAVWCLACDPNAATKGYDPATGALPLSAYTCNRIKSFCYPFISHSQFQSLPIGVAETVAAMDAFTALIYRIRDGTFVSVDAFEYTSPNPPAGDLPDTCTSQDTCNYICNDLFRDGSLQQGDLVAGSSIDDGRLLEQNEQRMLTDRELQTGTYRPADDESGVTVTFTDDPGNATKSSSRITSFASVLIGAIMLLLSYLL